MSRWFANLLVVGLLIIAALTGWALVSSVRQGVQSVAGPSNGVATEVQALFNPTPTIYPDSVTVVRSVQSLARLESVQYTIEKVIRAETGQGVFGPLLGDRLLFVAHGEVIAGVDLSKMGPSDVLVSSDGRVTVIVPSAEIFVTRLDNEKSYVYERATGLFTKGDINLETQARQVAEDEIRNGALEDGILSTAQTNANNVLERLLRSLGFTDVVIVVATPTTP
ncbi:MAG TPA: DUF4230 domain-containing protein [Anaerolineales bacterium]|nr:DUF4230 domain-containing protein [Anaerolineales bacterium]HRF47420.1 DUF4230 domain-containing protein [Anaerolineales bacterium]